MRPIRKAIAAAATFALAALSLPAAAQIETVDPDTMIDGDLVDPPARDSAQPGFEGAYEDGAPGDRYDSAPTGELPPVEPGRDVPTSTPAPATRAPVAPATQTATQAATQTGPVAQAAPAAQSQTTYAEDDLIGAAEGLFGRGAEGLARMIQDILSEQGEPNGYIVGREAGGAFVVGVRYGSGTLHHKVEGNMPVYWTGPSIGLDAGANAGNTFVLVYNLYDTDELYERFPAGEGQAYLVGGFNASYVRKGDVVLIPIRVGAGLRLGVNAGYMRFSRNQRWLPF